MSDISGSCITSVMPGEVCGLEAVATECRENSVEATVCECAEGYIYQANKCIGEYNGLNFFVIRILCYLLVLQIYEFVYGYAEITLLFYCR